MELGATPDWRERIARAGRRCPRRERLEWDSGARARPLSLRSSSGVGPKRRRAGPLAEAPALVVAWRRWLTAAKIRSASCTASRPEIPEAYLAIGATAYGKPILDRVIVPETTLADAKKAVLLSMDSTLRSNLSVGMPLDLTVIERDQYLVGEVSRIEADDLPFQEMSRAWSQALRDAFLGIKV